MVWHRMAFVGIAALTLACVPPSIAPPPDAVTLVACGGDTLVALIGAPVSALPASGNWGSLRVLRPGDAMTMDFSARRLNVVLDANDLVQQMNCG